MRTNVSNFHVRTVVLARIHMAATHALVNQLGKGRTVSKVTLYHATRPFFPMSALNP